MSTIAYDKFRIDEGLAVLTKYTSSGSMFGREDCLCVTGHYNVLSTDLEILTSLGWVYNSFDKYWFLFLPEIDMVTDDDIVEEWIPSN